MKRSAISAKAERPRPKIPGALASGSEVMKRCHITKYESHSLNISLIIRERALIDYQADQAAMAARRRRALKGRYLSIIKSTKWEAALVVK